MLVEPCRRHEVALVGNTRVLYCTWRLSSWRRSRFFVKGPITGVKVQTIVRFTAKITKFYWIKFIYLDYACINHCALQTLQAVSIRFPNLVTYIMTPLGIVCHCIFHFQFDWVKLSLRLLIDFNQLLGIGGICHFWQNAFNSFLHFFKDRILFFNNFVSSLFQLIETFCHFILMFFIVRWQVHFLE